VNEEMPYAHLGRSGLLVSRIGLGTMNFGYTVDEPSSFAVMDAAIDAGINFFDTADVYGGPQSPDMKETVGRWLQRSGHRDDIVLATKVYQPMGLGPNDRRLSAYHIRRACEASLRRLQTDHIDLYQMHHVDRATPWEENLAGDGAAGPLGQDQLRRQQQLRRLGRGPRPVRRLGTALHGPHF
jgi:aryl-alcohol dehydrogenase-like predicted oxidoreductase